MARQTPAGSNSAVAKVFMHGRSQAVRLPKAFRFDTTEVRVRRVGRGVLLEPMVTDVDQWFAAMDRHLDTEFMARGREQPAPPADPPSWDLPE
ncbi:antitoxin [Phytoactinopolyspora mesophila]|uniref:AbrB/MazE/SpoVT family DNA-binding domain-containing protein n=1 Tax=Phytoactinopolyspora mesophila TaxID=2650750 RepID=A0A7K3MAV6_9ACTN|nr:type II toxin-antitoxin system VapB family antitoxin [Phytoactinopolyspora mesophila]NDL60310.1 AbrB/MazE/SpoVT family DNA-binding domain-containing protein [Phytoactinopolyspora mesophila]